MGARLHFELFHLAKRWQALAKQPYCSGTLSVQKAKPKNLKIETRFPKFHSDSRCTQNIRMKLYAAGPEHNKNFYKKELLNYIQREKEEIVIDHLYFHPTQDVIKELAKAVDRGVRVKIITNGYDKKLSPAGHSTFFFYSRWCYKKLRDAVKNKTKLSRLSYLEFVACNTTLHKKIILFGNHTLFCGNGNLGYKSLKTTADHELNLIIESKQHVLQAKKEVLNDIKKSKLVNPSQLKINFYKKTIFTLLKPLID